VNRLLEPPKSSLSTRLEWAASLFTPIEELEQLLTDESPRVRRTAAENPALPSSLGLQMQRLERQDSELSADDLEKLASLGPYARRQVARHRHTYPVTLERLLEEGYAHELAQNSALPPELMTRLLERSELYSILLENQRLSKATYQRFLASEDARVRLSLSRNPFLSVKGLEPLMDDEDWEVRESLCYSSQLSGEMLERLSQDRWNPSVREAVAKHPHTSAGLLERLSRDEDVDVREAVAFSANANEPTLERLAKDSEPRVRIAVCANPNSTQSALDVLEPDPNPKIQALLSVRFSGNSDALERLKPKNVALALALATHPLTPNLVLERLASHRNVLIRSWIAVHPQTPPGVRTQLERDPRWEVAWPALAYGYSARPLEESANTPYLTSSLDLRVRYALASNPEALPERLEHLASDPNPALRYALAYNPQTPLTVLEQLAEHEVLRPVLAAHPVYGKTLLSQLEQLEEREAGLESTPEVRLWRLSHSPREEVRLRLAQNSNCPSALLERLSEDNSLRIRGIVAAHPQTPEPALLNLARGGSEAIGVILLARPTVSPALLELLSHHPSQWVRLKLATLDNLPQQIVSQLFKDNVVEVKETMARNSSLTSPLVHLLVLARGGLQSDLSLAQHPKIGADTLDLLERRWSGESPMTQALLAHPHLSIRTLERMAVARFRALENSQQPYRKWLHRWGLGASSSAYLQPLRLLAHHPNLTVEILEQLYKVDDPVTRQTVRVHPNRQAQVYPKTRS